MITINVILYIEQPWIVIIVLSSALSYPLSLRILLIHSGNICTFSHAVTSNACLIILSVSLPVFPQMLFFSSVYIINALTQERKWF